MRFTLSVFITVLAAQLLMAQSLPHVLTNWEQVNYPDYPQVSNSRGITTPPASPVRAMAEWEEVDYLTLSWTDNATWGYHDILTEIVRHAKDHVSIINICEDTADIKQTLQNNGVALDNQVFLESSLNSIWIRDFGQWNLYTNDVDSLLLLDFIYNRNRPSDNEVPVLVADHLGLPLYEMTQAPNDMVHTGGNFMVDGLGTGFSSELVLDENYNGNYNITDKTEAEIDTLMKEWMALDRYIKMEELPYDEIHHIDMHMKLLDEETLLVGEYPQGVADGPQIEANLQYVLDNFDSPFGTPYDVVRVTMPPDQYGDYPDNNGYYRTYTNMVILNDLILVPTYEEEYDTTALRKIRQWMPGYEVVGINSNDIIPASGAIHCITKEVGAADPLWIAHDPVDEALYNETVTFNALAKHRSGIAGATLYYTTDLGNGFNQSASMYQGFNPDYWLADLSFSQGDTVYYYIEANANSGKSQVRPMPAPEGYWKFPLSGTVAIDEPGSFGLGNIYPNPASAITVIPLQLAEAGYARVELLDMTGRVISTLHEGQLPAGEKNVFLNAATLSSGAYLVNVTFEGATYTQKLMVK